MAGIGTPALSSTGGGGGSSTITTFLGSTTAGPMNIAEVGGSSFALGQQLAAASLPVVLTASQLTTLTPPSNTGYALDSSLSTINTSINTLLKPASTLTAVTTVTTVSTVSNISQIASTTPTFTSQALDVNIKSETAPAVTLTRVAIAASTSGDNTLIAAVTSKKIYVVAFELSFSGTVNAKFTDGAAGTNLGGLYYGVANAGAANSISPDMKLAIPSPYLWVGSTNTALILNLSGAVAVGGAITYFTV